MSESAADPDATSTSPVLVPNHKVQPYTSDELVARINEQSVDPNRLAATLYSVMDSVKALANWANGQIQGGDAGAETGAQMPEAKKRSR